MLRYKITINRLLSGELELPSDNPNRLAALEYKGSDRFVEALQGLINASYGAFGHLMSASGTTPIDLDCVLCKLRQQGKVAEFELLEGRELVKNYDPGIPRDAVS